MNVLVLDPKTVCVEKSEKYQAEQLDKLGMEVIPVELRDCLLYTSPSPRDTERSRMPSSA